MKARHTSGGIAAVIAVSAEEFERADTDGGEIAAGDVASVWYEVVPRASPQRYLPRQNWR